MSFSYLRDIDHWLSEPGNSVANLRALLDDDAFAGAEYTLVREWLLDFGELSTSEKARLHLREKPGMSKRLFRLFGPTTIHANLRRA